ncbi:hypothetical protein [Plebeiibacterium marinum]|uniref:Uncharacterized protein n=1 Tax=Plebeiibacterium marinum TaxID=2992111 RepID=A0AAE3MH68_9BACT|nr:hypothetical protein [Plebeiobacterium marinum]MCW3806987.1 hypothetical protein [Plebeiobacterium marinum]
MKQVLLFILFLIIICTGCFNTNNKISVVSFDFTNSYSQKSSSHRDSILNFIKILKSDIVEVRGFFSFEHFKNVIDENEYEILCTDTIYKGSLSFNNFLLINKKVISLLTSSTQFENKGNSFGNKVVSWYKFKYLKTGYIFYLFKLNVGNGINPSKRQLLSYNLLKKVHDISSGAPVVIMSYFDTNNEIVSELITKQWKGHYNLFKAPVKRNKELKFFTNDFFKIKSINENVTDSYLMSNISIKFSQKTKIIKKNSYGDVLPE